MAGFLDALMNLSPEQSNALINFGGGLLQAGGPSTKPIGFGQAFGGALQQAQAAMAEAEQRKLQQQAAQQQAKLLGLKIQDSESDLKNQEMMRARQQQIAQQIAALGQGGGDNAPQVTPVAQRANPFDYAAPAPASAQGAPASQPKVTRTEKYANRLLDEAAIFSQNGDFESADKRYQAAFKMLPQVEGRSVERDPATGQLVNVITFKDGTQRVSEFGVKPDIQILSLGGRDEAVDKNAVRPGQTFQRTQSPDSAASTGLARERLNFDRQQANKPVFNESAGGFVIPPSQQNPGGQLVPLAGVPGKAPTEFQGKSAAFGLRATEADKILNQLAGKYSPAAINSKVSVQDVPIIGGGLGTLTNTYALSENDQRAEQAQRDFINAILRQESGAAIGQDEFDNARRQYFPQPGDSKGTIEQKARNRKLAIQGLQANAGRAALTAPSASDGWGIQKVSN